MITVSQIQTLITSAKAAISSINTTALVVDDSEVIRFMEKQKPSDNLMLMAVIPEYDTTRSRGIDSISTNNHLMFMVLEKLDYSAFKNEQARIDFWNRTQAVMIEFMGFLIDAAETGLDGSCPPLQWLDPGSIRIEPVWRFGMGNGWSLSCSVKK